MFSLIFILGIAIALLSLWKKDQDWWRSKVTFIRAGTLLPFTEMVGDSYLKCEDGTLSAVFKLKPVDYALFTSGKFKEFEKHRQRWLDEMAGLNARVRMFTFRDAVSCSSTGEFPNEILKEINDVWMNDFKGAYINNHYIVVSLSPTKLAVKKIMPSVARLNELVEITQDLLFDFDPELLKRSKLSPILSFWPRVAVFENSNVGEGGDINNSIASSEILFNKKGYIEIDDKYVKAISINTWGSACNKKVMEDILRLDSEMIAFHNWQGKSKMKATMSGFGSIGYQANQIKQFKGEESEEYQEYMGVLHGIKSDEASLSEYQLTVFVSNKDLGKCEQVIDSIKKILNQDGIKPIKAGKTLKWLYLSMFPSNEDLIYPARLLSNLMSHWIVFAGEALGFDKTDWGEECIRVLPTVNGGMYKHTYHIDSQLVGLGHGVMIAPSNAGKTTLANFLASAATRLGVMIFIFDRNFASKIFTKTCGGTYVALDNVLNPFYCEDDADNREMLVNLLLIMGNCDDDRSKEDARVAVDNILAMPKEKRILTNLFQDGIRKGKLKKGLEFWVGDNPYSRWFNGQKDGMAYDALDISSNNHIISFDMTEIQKNNIVASSVQYYLMHRIKREMRSNARPHLIFIDEAKPQLQNPQFCGYVSQMLLEHRKLRGVVLPCFQDVGSLYDSPIGEIMHEQAKTKYIFQNPEANKKSYEPLGLTEYEWEFVKGDLPICKQYPHSVLIKRKHELRVFYADPTSVNLLNDLEERYKDSDVCWVREYLNAA